jgi:hypothetical protein
MQLRSALVAALVLALGVGCSTPASRIEDRQQLFDGYDAKVQADIRAGHVRPGFDEDMVWMALGDPDDKSVESTAEGEVLVWRYMRSSPGIGLSVGGGSYGGTSVGGGVGVGTPADKDVEAEVRFRDGVAVYVRQATE